MNQQLKTYIENNIFPMYDRYYSHGMLHINNVIKNCLMLAEYYNLDLNKAYTIAAYHDIGLSVNRENHEKESGKILSDSDRDFDIEILAKRQLATSIKNYHNLHTFDEHFERCYSYMLKRIEGFGHFNLWTDNSSLLKQRDEFERKYLDKKYTREIYKKEWGRIQADGTIEKIKNT